jgi:hypothetical protein
VVVDTVAMAKEVQDTSALVEMEAVMVPVEWGMATVALMEVGIQVDTAQLTAGQVDPTLVVEHQMGAKGATWTLTPAAPTMPWPLNPHLAHPPAQC